MPRDTAWWEIKLRKNVTIRELAIEEIERPLLAYLSSCKQVQKAQMIKSLRSAFVSLSNEDLVDLLVVGKVSEEKLTVGSILGTQCKQY
jgi:hypothetical protein